MENARITWVDNMKFICILCVMLSHLESGSHALDVLYTPFFLTGFLFAAGYVCRQEPSFSVFFRKKVRGLFVPWLVFSVGNILLSQVFSFHDHGNVWEELKWNFLQIRGRGDGLWFVAALFVAFIPFYFLMGAYERSEVRNKPLWLCLITFMLSLVSVLYTKCMVPAALPWHLEYAFQAVFFMTLGYLSRHHGMNGKGWSTVACYLVILIPVFLKPELPLAVQIIYDYAAQVLGVFALAFLCRRIPGNPFISCIGGNTIVCFALHGKVLSLLEWSLRRFLPEIYSAILGSSVFSSMLAVMLTLMMALLLLIPIYILNRWFPFLLGRKVRKR